MDEVHFSRTEDGPQITEDMKKWVEFAKHHKAFCVDTTERGDITPTVIIERDNQVLAIISAPEIDKEQGLSIAALSKAGFDPDHLTILLDAHMTQINKEGQTMEQAREEFRKKYPPGSMQKMCDEEGACDKGEITDCLICHRISRDGTIELMNLPYSYHGKSGPAFKWIENPEQLRSSLVSSPDEKGEDVKIVGYIPDSLRKIMSLNDVFKQVPWLEKLAQKLEFSEEQARFHTARAVMYLMARKECIVKDFLSPMHMEWIDYKPRAAEILASMKEKTILPREAISILQKIVDNSLGTKSFQKEFAQALKDHPYWLSQEQRGKEDFFAFLFESQCMSPNFPELDEFIVKNKDKFPKRVKVWNGDQSKYLGEGNYVGDVKVYFIKTEDGISSAKNAEEEPEPWHLPDDAKVLSMDDNPKIILDNGETIYGCQCYWQIIEESETPNHKPNAKKPR